jgi:hypothetical protein
MLSLTASVTLLAMAFSAASAPVPLPQAVSIGDINTPSLGGTFNDFKAASETSAHYEKKMPADAFVFSPLISTRVSGGSRDQ